MIADTIIECRDVHNRPHGVKPEASISVSTTPIIDRGTTLLSLLQRAAIFQPQNGLVFRDTSVKSGFSRMTYGEILEHAMINATILTNEGTVTPGRPIVMYFDQYRDSIIWYWSVVAAGGIPALLPPPKGGDEARRRELEHISQLFGHPKTLTARSTAPQFLSQGGFSVTCIEDLPAQHEAEQLSEHILESIQRTTDRQDDTCTILFTSGSTGHSKAVCFSHRQLLASSYLKCSTHKTTPTDRYLCWISFDHSVALCELHLHAMEAGANLYMIPGSEFTQNPVHFWRVLSENRISYTFAPNSFLAAALRAQEEAEARGGLVAAAYNFRALRVLFCGGEANRTSTLQAASDFVTRSGAPQTAITSVYGLSETCSALFYNRHGPAYDTERGYAFASVGTPLPTHQTRIVDKEQQPAKVGAIQLSGPMIFRGYYNNATATAACTTVDGWFDTGDLGYMDDQGNLVIVGRSKDVLVLNGQNYSCGELDYAIETCGVDGLESGYTVSFSIWNDESDSEEVVILFNPAMDKTEDTPWLRNIVAEIVKAVVGFCSKRPLLVVPLPKSRLPRSSIGKLSRAKLRDSLLAGEFDAFKLRARTNSAADNFSDPRQATIAQAFEDCLKIPAADLSPDLLIETLGIDSLNLLRLRSGIEKAFNLTKTISLPQIASCPTIRDIDVLLQTIDADAATPYVPLQVLRKTGSRTPLILCHTGNGGFLNYMGIWQLLADRPIAALHARGLEPHHKHFETLEEMLDTYADAIKRHQPSGPYAIFGVCFGGLLAFELTKRLEAMGDEVLFCGGLDAIIDLSVMQDASTSDSKEKLLENVHLARHYNLLDILVSSNIIPHSDFSVFLDQLSNVPGDRVVEEGLRLLPPEAIEQAGLSKDKLESWVDMSANTHVIAHSYRATGSVRTYDVFYVKEPPLRIDVADSTRWRYVYQAEWARHVQGASNFDVCYDFADMDPIRRAGRPLRFHRVNGTHDTITATENHQSLSRFVNDALLMRESERQLRQS